jgi:hypothetical protein
MIYISIARSENFYLKRDWVTRWFRILSTSLGRSIGINEGMRQIFLHFLKLLRQEIICIIFLAVDENPAQLGYRRIFRQHSLASYWPGQQDLAPIG